MFSDPDNPISLRKIHNETNYWIFSNNFKWICILLVKVEYTLVENVVVPVYYEAFLFALQCSV